MWCIQHRIERLRVRNILTDKERTYMEKKPFVTKEQLEEIAKTYPTPFYLYDEKGIRENAMKLKEAFSWNKGFREYLYKSTLASGGVYTCW